MRHLLALLTALPLCAQGAERHWYFDVHQFMPSLTGHFNGVSNDEPINVDLGNDLGLGRSRTWTGAGLEYQGPRFGLEFSIDRQDYTGSNRVSQPVTIQGETFQLNTQVNSSVQATNTSFNWTTRILARPRYWLGVDLGVRNTALKLDATGTSAFSGITAAANYRVNLPVPQVGPSLGFTALDDRLVGRGLFHFLTYKGATYTRMGADLRYFPVSWLGLRAFVDSERFRVPDGSIKDDLDITLDRTGFGFGIVFRY